MINNIPLPEEWGDTAFPAEKPEPVLQKIFGKPLPPPELDFEFIMRHASEEMHKIAIMASKSTHEPTLSFFAEQKRYWTMVRANAAASFVNSEMFALKLAHIDDLQKQIDCADSAEDKASAKKLVAEISPLRKEIARITGWTKDLKKV
jgi:hypothetical protein